MNDNKIIKNEYERLKSLFASLDQTKTEHLGNLLNKTAFMKLQLSNLREQIKKFGAVQISNKGARIKAQEYGHEACTDYNVTDVY